MSRQGTSHMKRVKAWLYAGFLIASVVFMTLVGYRRGPTPGSIRWRIQLLPRKGRAWLHPVSRHSLKELGHGALVRVAARRSFPKWKTYEDEYLSFSYPDNPLIRLETKVPGDRIPIMGQPMRTNRITFFRAYRLALGPRTYCLLLLDRNDDFDDSVCLCGPVVYEKYVFHNGALCRFSFLPTGEVKRFQLLCNGLRLVLFELTHLPMHEDVYLDIALSLKMRNGPCDAEQMKKAVLAKYDFEGRLGFLEKGMTRSDVVDLLGPPSREDRGILHYVTTKPYDGGFGTRKYERTTRLDLHKGSFAGFGKNWLRWRELPPERGTPEWILEKAEYKERTERPKDYDLGPLKPNEVKYVFDRIAELLPEASPGHWAALCSAAYKLHRQGLKDDRVLPLVRARYLEKDLSTFDASWILHLCDPEGSQDLFERRIRLTLDEARKRAAAENKKEQFLTSTTDMDFSNLLGFLEEAHPERVELIAEAMDHPHSQIRSDAYWFWDSVPTEVARPRLIRGLTDPDGWIRERSASAFAKGFGTPEDIAFLRQCRAKETNKRIQKGLDYAVKRLEALKPD